MKKILVVDDDEDILGIVKYILESDGLEVFTHNTGLAVNEAIDSVKPDLVLLDIGLPGKSGTDVCKEIKATYTIPVLFFSAHSNQEKALSICPAEGFIAKPFDINDLVSTVQSYVREKVE
jgi:DNA-binding response OmpR family regulator